MLAAAAREHATSLVIADLRLLLDREACRPVLQRAARARAPALVGVLDDGDYDRLLRQAPEVLAHFTALHVHAATQEEAARVLERERGALERHHGVRVGADAVRAAVELGGRHFTGRALPGIARDLLDEAAGVRRARTGAADRPDATPAVGRGDVARAVQRRKELPGVLVDTPGPADTAELERRLRSRLLGQEAAVASVIAALRRARSGVADPDRPIASFLLVGPTGVGKTELARVLAAELFGGGQDALLRLDMVNFQESHSVARLTGAPPGYVGYAQEGELSARLRRRPHAVVLLDEIEKAHNEVFHVLLPLLEHGRLVDARGQVLDARQAIFLMTSNTGTRHILDEELTQPEIARRVAEVVRRTLPPEFLNRIDGILTFRRLDARAREGIVALQVDRLRQRLAERGIDLEVEPDALRWLAERGYDPAYGARPLQSAIREHLEGLVAGEVLAGRLGEGSRLRVACRADGNALEPARNADRPATAGGPCNTDGAESGRHRPKARSRRAGPYARWDENGCGWDEGTSQP